MSFLKNYAKRVPFNESQSRAVQNMYGFRERIEQAWRLTGPDRKRAINDIASICAVGEQAAYDRGYGAYYADLLCELKKAAEVRGIIV